MEIPTNAVEGARVFEPKLDIEDTASAWQALTLRKAPTRKLDAETRRAATLAAEREGVDLALPEVLITVPPPLLPHGSTAMYDDPSPEALRGDGYRADRYGRLVERPAQAPHKRPRRAVVRWQEASPTPEGARALTVATLGARLAAEHLDEWAPSAMRSEASRAASEADAYRAYADECEARLPDAFASWVAELDEPTPVQAFPTVPAVVRVVAQSGPT